VGVGVAVGVDVGASVGVRAGVLTGVVVVEEEGPERVAVSVLTIEVVLCSAVFGLSSNKDWQPDRRITMTIIVIFTVIFLFLSIMNVFYYIFSPT
jgi:uncharacterized membrane protein